MQPRNQSKIGLDKTRVAQLHDIASHKGITCTALLDKFIRQQWRKIGKSDLPGYRITTTNGSTVHLTGRDNFYLILSFVDAQKLATALLEAAKNGQNKKFVTELGETVFVYKKGRGLILAISPDAEVVLTQGLLPSIAEDLALLLIREIGEGGITDQQVA
jgi:hypothetical protein